jgi:hypothetical protein
MRENAQASVQNITLYLVHIQSFCDEDDEQDVKKIS